MLSAPKDIYGPNIFKIFVDELGGPKVVSKFLDVTERSVFRWLASEKVPRPVVLALFWETRWGRSLIDTDQVNEIRLMYRRIQILESQYTRAKEIVTGLRRLNTGTANEAYFDELEDLHAAMPNTYGATVRQVAAAG